MVLRRQFLGPNGFRQPMLQAQCCRQIRHRMNSAATRRTDRAATEYANVAHATRDRSSLAAAAGWFQPVLKGRPRRTQTKNWLRFPAAGAPDRRADWRGRPRVRRYDSSDPAIPRGGLRVALHR